MKKLSIISLSVVVAFTVFALVILNKGNTSNTLYLLNWGEYIDESLLETFEEETGCQVILETVTSSETMYQKITAGTTEYDVAIPGDYMVTKLYNEGYLYEIDVNNPEYTNLNGYQTMFNDKLQTLINNNMTETMTYCMPYFWGAYSMIYSTRNSENENVVKTNGFKALFDKSLYSHKASIGMYNTARWAITAYMLANNQDPNIEDFNNSDVVNGIKSANFDMWADDALKRKTATGDLDLCFTQLGDFFDAVYLALEEGMGGNVGLDQLPFDVYVPSNSAAFFDAMVIPTTSSNQVLANKFINFMLDPDNAFQNALAIGYSPTLKSVINMYTENPEEEYFSDDNIVVTLKDLTTKYPFYLDPLCEVSDLNSVTLLEPKGSAYMTRCETIINQAKAYVNTDSNAGTVICIIVLCALVIGSGSYIAFKVYNRKKRVIASV
ncbi:MAG: PotD/PotF family extracellular solute-binding protein [Anaeroplasmataceae bacterium]